MATLEKIRNRAGILVAIVIGLALVAFIMGDLFDSGQSLFSRNQFEIAKVSGKSIPVQEYEKRVQELMEIYRMNTGRTSLEESTVESIREQTWQQMIQEQILGDQYNRVGVTVSSEELFDMVQGANPHPIIMQMFSNPETGEFNQAYVLQFLSTLSADEMPEQRAYWLFIEQEILRERTLEKYQNLISKGLYATTLEAEKEFYKANTRVDFSYVMKRYTDIADTAVTISRRDLVTYHRENRNQFKQEAGRDIEYVTFEVLPSESDFHRALEWIEDIKEEFIEAEDDRIFLNMNSDVPFDGTNYKDGELPELINDFAFSAEVGDVFGPYLENDAYKLTKLSEINYLPDSVNARHILLRPQAQTRQAFTLAMDMADSLKREIEGGANFAELARIHSVDGSSADGGNLGWFTEGTMVKPFNDACFEGNVSDLVVVESEFGVHLIEILNKSRNVKKVKVANLVRNVEPSDDTYQQAYNQASRFAANNRTPEKFDSTVEEENLIKRNAYNLKENDRNISGLESPRELIRWAYNANKDDISGIFEFGNKFVVAKLVERRDEGIAPLEKVEEEVENIVRQQKKAAFATAKFKEVLPNATTIDDVAAALSLNVQDATNVAFTSSSVPGLGFEPKIIAAATALEPYSLSNPVDGNNGVFVIFVTELYEPEVAEYAHLKTRLRQNFATRASYEPLEALKENANIVDSRSKFY